MKDIYAVVPNGCIVVAAADDFDRASMAMAGLPDGYWIQNLELLEEGD